MGMLASFERCDSSASASQHHLRGQSILPTKPLGGRGSVGRCCGPLIKSYPNTAIPYINPKSLAIPVAPSKAQEEKNESDQAAPVTTLTSTTFSLHLTLVWFTGNASTQEHTITFSGKIRSGDDLGYRWPLNPNLSSHFQGDNPNVVFRLAENASAVRREVRACINPSLPLSRPIVPPDHVQ